MLCIAIAVNQFGVQGVMQSARSHTSSVSHTSTSSTKHERKPSGVMSRILEGIFGCPEDSEVTKVLHLCSCAQNTTLP